MSRGQKEVHGVVVVITSTTLHRLEVCVEQYYMLLGLLGDGILLDLFTGWSVRKGLGRELYTAGLLRPLFFKGRWLENLIAYCNQNFYLDKERWHHGLATGLSRVSFLKRRRIKSSNVGFTRNSPPLKGDDLKSVEVVNMKH